MNKYIFVLSLISNPLRRSIVLTFLLIIALYPESGLSSKNTIFGLTAILAVLINMLAILINIVFLVIKIIFIKINERENLRKKAFKLAFVMVIPILAIISIPILEYTASYVFVRTMGDSFIQQIPSKPNQSFKYGRFKLHNLKSYGGLWIIYDASEQVALPTQSRSQEWWQVSNESDEAESASCWSPARKLYNHFFIRYINC